MNTWHEWEELYIYRIRNTRTKHVGKSQSCMVRFRLRIFGSSHAWLPNDRCLFGSYLIQPQLVLVGVERAPHHLHQRTLKRRVFLRGLARGLLLYTGQSQSCMVNLSHAWFLNYLREAVEHRLLLRRDPFRRLDLI